MVYARSYGALSVCLAAMAIALGSVGCQSSASRCARARTPATVGADRAAVAVEALEQAEDELRYQAGQLRQARSENCDLRQQLSVAVETALKLKKREADLEREARELQSSRSRMSEQHDLNRKLREQVLDARIANARLKQAVVRFKISEARQRPTDASGGVGATPGEGT